LEDSVVPANPGKGCCLYDHGIFGIASPVSLCLSPCPARGAWARRHVILRPHHGTSKRQARQGMISVAAEFAPIVPAVSGLLAALLAVISTLHQRNTARRRTAIDFFLKTQMDATGIELYNDFRRIAPGIAAITSMESFVATPEHSRVRSFLNVCELISVAINEKVFSEQVSYAYWGDVLPWSFKAAEPLIQYVRQRPGEGTPATYRDLEKVAKLWAERNARQKRR